MWRRPEAESARQSFLKERCRKRLQPNSITTHRPKQSPFSMQNPQDSHVPQHVQDSRVPQHAQDPRVPQHVQDSRVPQHVQDSRFPQHVQALQARRKLLWKEQQTYAMRMQTNSIAIRMATQWNRIPSYSPDTLYSEQSNGNMLYFQVVDEMMEPEA
jgi:hypothetical protein